MSEFMGLISGDYDAKVGGGFKPAGASLANTKFRKEVMVGIELTFQT
jgi:homogentisate 1,2-dioxygenase